jgi:tRNA (guanine-N7-)-methyltransferase
MRLRNISGSKELLQESRYVCGEPVRYKGKWQERFGKENPVHLEIGMGRGQFLTRMAQIHPEVNYIGIEKYPGVLYKAARKCAKAADDLENVVLLCMDAHDLRNVFAEGEISKIYLNFSDPWPKQKHARRRITSRDFLDMYQEVLAAEGELELKTDNESLYRFSLKEMEAVGWRLAAASEDLHNDIEMRTENVKTEYEERFSAQGKTIYWCRMAVKGERDGVCGKE